jgi:hypothetical protein
LTRRHHHGRRGRSAVAPVDDHHTGDHREYEDDPGDGRDRTPALVARRLIAVGVDVVDGVIGIVLKLIAQVICGADDADVSDVTCCRRCGSRRVRSRFANSGCPREVFPRTLGADRVSARPAAVH